jgi:hypothetical protein
MAQASQELQQLYSDLINRMKQGVEMHEQLADYYGFLNLPGYQKCHEYQMLCELLTYRKAKDMYMKEYNQLVQPATMMSHNGMGNMNNNNNNNNNGQNNNSGMNNMNNNYNYNQVIPQNWYKYTRYDVDSSTKRNAVRDGFKRWLDYERETKEYLTQMGQRLEAQNEREAARKLEYLIDHVEHEIEHAEEKMMELENSGYDMNYILQQQDHLKAKYADKIRKLNSKEDLFRQRGRGNYANYNNYDNDDDDDDFEYRYYYPRYYKEGRY